MRNEFSWRRNRTVPRRASIWRTKVSKDNNNNAPIRAISDLLEEIRCLQVALCRDRLRLDDLRRRRLPLGVVRERLELRVVLLEPVQVRLQLLHRLLVRALLLARLGQLVLQVRDRVRLLLHRLHPPLHQLHLHTRLLDRLVFDPNRPRERLHLVVKLRDLTLCFDVDCRGCLDVVDAEDPRRRARNWEDVSTAQIVTFRY